MKELTKRIDRNTGHFVLGRRRGEQGFTLVEVLVASFLMLMISLALLGAQVSGRHLARKARIHMEAINIAQSALEVQKALNYDNVQTVPASNVLITDNGTPGDSADDITGAVVVNVTPNGSTKRVDVTVSWNHIYYGATVTSSLDLSTVVSNI